MSADDQPIVCSLSATDLSERLAEIASIGNDALLHVRNDGRHAELCFATGRDVRERVDAIVVAESQCCAFLAMRVTDTPDGVVLRIDAPEGAEIVVRELVAAFRGLPQAA